MVLTPSTADHITERFDGEHQARTFEFTERKGVNSVKSVNTFYHSELTKDILSLPIVKHILIARLIKF